MIVLLTLDYCKCCERLHRNWDCICHLRWQKYQILASISVSITVINNNALTPACHWRNPPSSERGRAGFDSPARSKFWSAFSNNSIHATGNSSLPMSINETRMEGRKEEGNNTQTNKQTYCNHNRQNSWQKKRYANRPDGRLTSKSISNTYWTILPVVVDSM